MSERRKVDCNDPLYHFVGTNVIVQHNNIFRSGTIKNVVKLFMCTVKYSDGSFATLPHNDIVGPLLIDRAVHIKSNDFVVATVTEIKDFSLYTVEFDEGGNEFFKRESIYLKDDKGFRIP